MSVSVFLIDDHDLFREALASKLSLGGEHDLVGSVASGVDAIPMLASARPNVVLLDVNLQGVSGIDLCQVISHQFQNTKVVMLSMDVSRSTVLRATRAGALAYVSKDDGYEYLRNAIASVMLGRRYFSPSLNIDETSTTMSSLNNEKDASLTPRQVEIIKLAAGGCSTKIIAQMLNLSEKTVESHRNNIYQKLSINNLADLTRYAIRKGIISL